MTTREAPRDQRFADALPGPAFDERRFLAIVALCGVGLGMTAPITVLYASSFGAGPAVAGLTWSSLAVSLLAVDVLGTRVVPRLDGRTMLWSSLTIFGVGQLASAAAPSLVALIASRVVQGVGAAIFMGGGLQLVVRAAPPERVGRAIGTFNATLFAGISTGPLIGGGLGSVGSGQTGFRVACAVCGAVSGLAAIAARLGLPSIPALRAMQIGLPRRPRARPGLQMWPALALGGLGQALRGGVVFTVIPLFGSDHLGLATAEIGLGLSALAVVDIATMRVGGILVDRFRRSAILSAALVAGVVACASAPLVAGLPGFLVWCAAVGLSVGATSVVPAVIVVDVAAETEPAIAAFRISGDAGEIVGATAVGGLVGSVGHGRTFGVVGGLLALVAAWTSRLPEARDAGRAGEARSTRRADSPEQVARWPG